MNPFKNKGKGGGQAMLPNRAAMTKLTKPKSGGGSSFLDFAKASPIGAGGAKPPAFGSKGTRAPKFGK